MRNAAVVLVCGLLLSAGTSGALQGQTQKQPDEQQSCRKAAQKFYDWYVPKVLQNKADRAPDTILKYDRSAFSARLFRGLAEDSAAQAKSEDLVGLDFDPFLGGQDTCQPYSLGKVTLTGNICLVEVRGSSCGKNAKPDVVPELSLTNGHWVFINFYYPQLGKRENLLSTLVRLRKERRGLPAK